MKTPETGASGASIMMNSQVTWSMHRPIQSFDEAPGFPESCILRLCRRWFFEFPRIPHPSAKPAIESPGCPESSLSSIASDEASGRPESCIFRQFRLADLRVSSNHAPFGSAKGESPGRPESSLLRLASRWISGLPRISHPPAVPAMLLRVSPDAASSGGPGD
jgi:hypothetical protein